MDYVLRRALIGHLTLDAFGHQLHLILDVLLEIAICRPTRHRAYRSHAAIAFVRSEEHTSELQSLMRISYAVFCLKKHTIHSNIIALSRSVRQTTLLKQTT